MNPRFVGLVGAMAGLLPVAYSVHGQSQPLTEVGDVTITLSGTAAFTPSPSYPPVLRDAANEPLPPVMLINISAPPPAPLMNDAQRSYGVGAGGGHMDSLYVQVDPDVGKVGDGKRDTAQGGVSWSTVTGGPGDRFEIVLEARNSAEEAYVTGEWTGTLSGNEQTPIGGVSLFPSDASTGIAFSLRFSVPLGGTATLVTPDLSGLTGIDALHSTETLVGSLTDFISVATSGSLLSPQVGAGVNLTWGPGDASESVVLEGGRTYEYSLVYTAEVPFGVDPQFGLTAFVDLVFTPQSAEVPEAGTVLGGLSVAAVAACGVWRRRKAVLRA